MKRKTAPPGKLEASNPEKSLEYVSDSSEQMQSSIRYIGYHDKLEQAFKIAIARAKKTSQ